MRVRRALIVAFATAAAAGALAFAASAQTPSRLPGPPGPAGSSGQAIYPAFEGWGANQDATSNLMVLGYMNRNRSGIVEIPIGPDNRIEPGGPDYGQPTVFYAGRQKVMFAIKVPKDFGAKTLTWTLVANGQPAVVTFHLQRDYYLNFYKDDANGNEPPSIKFGVADPPMIGPTAGFAQTLTASVGQPVPLTLWVSDPPPLEPNWESVVASRTRSAPRPVPRDQVAIVDGQVLGAGRGGRSGTSGGSRPDLTVVWTKMRGPGDVTVTPSRVPVVTKGDRNVVIEAAAAATFSAPGEYVLRGQPVEAAGAGDGLCCFTFANVKVNVK
jgi:hypothetical protein